MITKIVQINGTKENNKTTSKYFCDDYEINTKIILARDARGSTNRSRRFTGCNWTSTEKLWESRSSKDYADQLVSFSEWTHALPNIHPLTNVYILSAFFYFQPLVLLPFRTLFHLQWKTTYDSYFLMKTCNDVMNEICRIRSLFNHRDRVLLNESFILFSHLLMGHDRSYTRILRRNNFDEGDSSLFFSNWKYQLFKGKLRSQFPVWHFRCIRRLKKSKEVTE